MAKAKEVRLYDSISLKECADVVLRNSKFGMTTIVRGPNGWGKTRGISEELQKARPNHKLVIVDMSQMQAGDLIMPKFAQVGDADVVRGVPHEEFGLHHKQDVILILDEILKTPKALQVSCAQLVYDRRLGRNKISDDSIILGLSNLEEENFGDTSLGFFYNRSRFIEMRKPTSDEWVDDYALPRGLHPTIIQSAREYPSMFADHRDYKAGDNQYIYDPKVPQPFYVTGRSLEAASNVIFSHDGLPNEVLAHSLINTVGKKAALDIMGVHELHEQLPSWKDIVKDPMKAKLPDSAGARCMLIWTALQNIEDKTVSPWMTYLKRFQPEMQALFCSSVLRVTRANQIVSSNKAFVEWAMDNRDLYRPA